IISYITKNEIKEANEEFNNLSLEEKKKALISLIDKNKLYINYSDINDMNYNVTEDEKSFTKSFYEGV
ncbi:MAG: site-specific DNA-methyltransferase, partial [Clostridia bacterium]